MTQRPDVGFALGDDGNSMMLYIQWPGHALADAFDPDSAPRRVLRLLEEAGIIDPGCAATSA
jgi:hypothetical protein